jgi:hypothetical protein
MIAQKSRSQTIVRVFEKDRARYDRPDSRTVRSEPEMFQRGAYSQAALAKVRARWQVQRQVEYRSTSVFLDLSKQLMEAGASVEETAVAVRMAQDEYRHADLCQTVARALGCKTLSPLTTVLPKVAQHLDVSRQVAALRNVILCTCISETNAVANFIVELEELSDPYIRTATRALLADEVLHGEYGFRFLEDWAPFLASSESAGKHVPTVCIRLRRARTCRQGRSRNCHPGRAKPRSSRLPNPSKHLLRRNAKRCRARSRTVRPKRRQSLPDPLS